MAARVFGRFGIIAIDARRADLTVAEKIRARAHNVEVGKPMNDSDALIMASFKDTRRKCIDLLQDVDNVRSLVSNETSEIPISLAVIESAREQPGDVLRSLLYVVEVGVTRLALPVGEIAGIRRLLIERAANRKRNNNMPGVLEKALHVKHIDLGTARDVVAVVRQNDLHQTSPW
jgi:hypothetical protein